MVLQRRELTAMKKLNISINTDETELIIHTGELQGTYHAVSPVNDCTCDGCAFDLTDAPTWKQFCGLRKYNNDTHCSDDYRLDEREIIWVKKQDIPVHISVLPFNLKDYFFVINNRNTGVFI